MSISLDLIKQLRDKTGISITACKKALEEAGGDIQSAVDLLRKKGQAKSLDRADRSTNEGVVVIAANDSESLILALACETDFVAKNPDYIKAAQSLADSVLADSNFDVENYVSDLSLKMGEKVEVKSYKLLTGDVISGYVHSNNKIAAIVSLEGGSKEVAKNISMHSCATRPEFLNAADVTDEIIKKESEFWHDDLQKSGKPESIWDNILKGKEAKFRSQISLTAQDYVVSPDKTVAVYASENDCTVKEFVVLSV